MKLVAQVTVDAYRLYGLNPTEIEEYVTKQLALQITKEILNHMTISSTKNPIDDTITTTGSYTISTSNTYNGVATTTNTITGIGSNAYSVYSQINMRVVEYTKNGKVTRVELQKYDDSNDDWVKIPRIQLEE